MSPDEAGLAAKVLQLRQELQEERNSRIKAEKDTLNQKEILIWREQDAERLRAHIYNLQNSNSDLRKQISELKSKGGA